MNPSPARIKHPPIIPSTANDATDVMSALRIGILVCAAQFRRLNSPDAAQFYREAFGGVAR
ncbi:MAG: hypothetical protein PHD68_02530 [Rugosibacter sp.]|nr:hypothetical protein [Rugosibacter sp.]